METDPSAIPFGTLGSIIAANRDVFGKAFKVLSSLGLILVPFQNIDPTTMTAKSQSYTQLIDLNLSSLTLRGTAPHNGLVLRAFPVQTDVVAFSDESLQVLDITNRDMPFTAAQIDF